MFESAALGRACSNKEFEEKAPQLRMRLFNAQLQCIERKIPVLITVAGLVGSGRGAIINLLSEWMDSKHVQNHVFWLVTDEEKAHGAPPVPGPGVSGGSFRLPDRRRSFMTAGMVRPCGSAAARMWEKMNSPPACIAGRP